MKKTISILCCLIMAFSFVEHTSAVSTSAGAYALYCVNSHSLIEGSSQNIKMRNASTTKIMTALIAFEQAEKDDKVITFSHKMTAEGSSMYLEYGDKIKLSALAGGMLMASGNDGANAIAYGIAGSLKKFAKLMNKRANQIGMKNTNFVTPSGLDDDNHYTTAYDLCLLMETALSNKMFSKVSKEKSYTVHFENKKDDITYQNHNRLLSLYKYCNGGKTGYTMSAGRCLVSSAKKDGVILVAVTLNDRNDWKDHMSLYDYGFSKYKCVMLDDTKVGLPFKVVGGNKETLSVKGEKQQYFTKNETQIIKRVISKEFFLYAPIHKGDVVGKITYYIDDKKIAENKIFAKEKIYKQKTDVFALIKEFIYA